MQQEAGAATASRVQLAEQEAGAPAAAGPVHGQPKQEPATALPVSQVEHRQPDESEGEESVLSGEECGTRT